MKPRLIIKQKLTAFTNKYAIYDAETSELVAFAQQKRFAFKEKVTFYTDESKNQEVFTFRAEKVMDVHGKYFVEDVNGTMLGMFQKEFAKSLLNSSWKMMDANGNELVGLKESSMILAMGRRFAGIIPIVGDILEIVTSILRYHFVFFDPKTQEELGMYRKQTSFRDHYELSMTDQAFEVLDWRVYAAMGVALDALQSR